MVKAIIKKVFQCLTGRVKLQHFFERLHRFSLSGMNFGGGDDVQSSGEIQVIKYLVQHVDRSVIPVVFDVGANIGNYSLEVLSVFGKDVRLYCFEPSTAAFTELAENISNYENVKAYNFGLGEKNETATLYSNSPGSGLGSVFARRLNHFCIEFKYKEEIELRRLDDFCNEKGISHINMLKLDVEGNELSVLKGAKQLIDLHSIDLIQFEFGGSNIDSKTYFQDFFYFLNPNYRIHRVLRNGVVPIDKYKETYEIFITTNYLAVSRRM